MWKKVKKHSAEYKFKVAAECSTGTLEVNSFTP